jgi:hypothetical protein
MFMRMCLHRIERLMRRQGLKARPRRRRLPPDVGERQTAAVAPNVLDRSFAAPAPNRRWIADFTYVWNRGGLAICGCRHRPVLAAGGRMVDEWAAMRIIEHIPDHFDALRLLGVCQLDCGHLVEAEQALRRAVTVNRRSAEVHSNLGAYEFLRRPF